MRSERGQATVEWIGLVVLVALGLAALARFAPRVDAGDLGPALLHAMGCAARGGCETPAARGSPAGRDSPATRGSPRRLVTAPPLAPMAPGERRWRAPRSRRLLEPLVRPGARGLVRPRGLARARRLVRGRRLLPESARVRWRGLVRRAGRGAGVLWRRAWMLCLGYERVRYGVLHPEIRFPRQTIPISENLRIANDCLSPADLVRDHDLIRGRP